MKALLLVAVFFAVAAVCGGAARAQFEQGMQAAQDDDFEGAAPEQLAKLKQLQAESAAAQAALTHAQGKAEALAKAKRDAETEVEGDANILHDAKSTAAQAKDELDGAKSRAAASPGDAALAKAEENEKAAEQAVADAQQEMDAKIAEMTKTQRPAEESAQAVKAAQATVDAKKGELDDFETHLRESLVEVHAKMWFEASVKLADAGHLIVVGTITPVGQVPAGTGDVFRYDRYPALERIVTPEGALYVRLPGKPWAAPEPGDRWKPGKPADEKESAELETMAGLAMGVLHPAAGTGEGAQVWKSMGSPTAFNLQREHPAAGEAVLRCMFQDSKQTASGQVLRLVGTSCDWRGNAGQNVTLIYYYEPQLKSPPAGPLPEELAAQAVRAAESAPRWVDAAVLNFRGDAWTRVAGVISGRDFDLTVITGVGMPVLRQIAVGGDFWTSNDGGATWKKQAKIDGTYFTLVDFGNVMDKPSWPLAMPLDEVDGGAGGGDPGEDKELKLLKAKDFSGPNFSQCFWVAMKDGKPGLRRLQMMTSQGTIYETIGDEPQRLGTAQAAANLPKGVGRVLPPPGNPAAVPGPSGRELLMQAIAVMNSTEHWSTPVLWKVEATVTDTPAVAGNAPAVAGGAAKRVQSVHGLMAGTRGVFDLTAEDFETNPKSVERMVSQGGTLWYLKGGDGAGAWQTSGHQAREGAFLVVYLPLDGFAAQPFEICGMEKRDGEMLLHMRCITSRDPGWTTPEYWLALDGAGKPAAIRRCAWDTGVTQEDGHAYVKRTEVVYTKAKADEKVVEPQGEENK